MNNKILKLMTSVLALNLVNKIFGFFRELLIAAKFGANYQTDSYNISMTIPNIILIIVSAAVTTSLIPIFVKIKNEEKEKLNDIVNSILNIFIISCIIICLILFIFNNEVIQIIAPGLDNKTMILTRSLSKITILNIIFLTIISIFDALLYAYGKFNISAVSECFLNIGLCAYIYLDSNARIENIVIVYLFILLIRVIFIYINLRKTSYKYGITCLLRNEYIKEVYLLILPVIGSSVILQLNSIIDKALSSTLSEGNISSLAYATKIYTLFHAIIVYPMIKILYPLMANLYNFSVEEFNKCLINFIKIFLIFIIPIWITLLINSKQIVEIIFGRGHFGDNAIYLTSLALKYFSILLVTLGLKDLLQIGFYSIKDTTTPSKNSILTVVLNILLSIILIKKLKIIGIALSTSIAFTFSTLILLYRLKRKLNLVLLPIYKTILTICVISVISIAFSMVFSYLFTFSYMVDTLMTIIIIFIIYYLLFLILYLFKYRGIWNLINKIKEISEVFKYL